MKYHVLLQTTETGPIHEFDYGDKDDIVDNVLEPYLLNDEFQFNGYFIQPSKVERLLVYETETTAKGCVDHAYKNLGSGIIMVISEEDCVFDNGEYGRDITRPLLNEVKGNIKKEKTRQDSSAQEEEASNRPIETIFLGYSYRQKDDEFVSGFKELLSDRGYEVLDGKADGLGSISQAIIEKIKISDAVVIVMTKRDKKENGKFTTAAWLLEEKGAGLALGKPVGMLVEEEIDDSDIGGMQGDNQRFHFTRNNFLKTAMNFLRVLSKEKT